MPDSRQNGTSHALACIVIGADEKLNIYLGYRYSVSFIRLVIHEVQNTTTLLLKKYTHTRMHAYAHMHSHLTPKQTIQKQ